MKHLRDAFVTGLLVLVPVMATLDILRWFIHAIDQSVRHFVPTFILPFDFKGLGLLIALVLVLVTGALTRNYVGKWFVNLLDLGIRRISIVGGLYGGIKKFLETVFNPRSDRFNGVVLVEFPRAGIYSIGFRTGKPDPNLVSGVSQNLVNVFVPCTPNPTSGFYLLVPEDALKPVNMSVQDAFKIVISMGIVTPEEHGNLRK